MKFLSTRFSRKTLAVLAVLSCLQVVGFVAFVAGFHAIALAVVMATSMLILSVALMALQKLNALSHTVSGRRVETARSNSGSGSSAGGEDRAEYIARRILAAFERERLETQIRFEQILRDIENRHELDFKDAARLSVPCVTCPVRSYRLREPKIDSKPFTPIA